MENHEKYFEIEKKIGRGAQHIVGRLRDGRLIKYPHWTGTRWDRSNAKTVGTDLSIHHEYDNPIPETSLVAAPTINDGQTIVRPPYAILLEEIRGRLLREVDFFNTSIREQFKTLLEHSLEIRKKTAKAVDFMGFESIAHLFEHLLGKIPAEDLGACNIMVDTRDQIKLIDTSLLSPARAPFGVAWAIDGLIDVQHGLMARVLQDPEIIRQSNAESHSPLTNSLADQVYRLSRPKNQTAPLFARRTNSLT